MEKPENGKTGKWKNRKMDKPENGQTGKWTKEQDNESTLSFQNYDSRRLLMFLYQALHKEKETSYLTLCMANFGLMATS